MANEILTTLRKGLRTWNSLTSSSHLIGVWPGTREIPSGHRTMIGKIHHFVHSSRILDCCRCISKAVCLSDRKPREDKHLRSPRDTLQLHLPFTIPFTRLRSFSCIWSRQRQSSSHQMTIHDYGTLPGTLERSHPSKGSWEDEFPFLVKHVSSLEGNRVTLIFLPFELVLWMDPFSQLYRLDPWVLFTPPLKVLGGFWHGKWQGKSTKFQFMNNSSSSARH